MIHCLMEPSEIYNDFAGNCEAYDAANGWAFGVIGSNGTFEPYDGLGSSFTDFLDKGFVKEDHPYPHARLIRESGDSIQYEFFER